MFVYISSDSCHKQMVLESLNIPLVIQQVKQCAWILSRWFSYFYVQRDKMKLSCTSWCKNDWKLFCFEWSWKWDKHSTNHINTSNLLSYIWSWYIYEIYAVVYLLLIICSWCIYKIKGAQSIYFQLFSNFWKFLVSQESSYFSRNSWQILQLTHIPFGRYWWKCDWLW